MNLLQSFTHRYITALALTASLLLLSFKAGDNSQLLYRNYVSALLNKSSFQYYLVVRVADAGNNEVREFCTLGTLFRNALHKEWKIDFDELSEKLVLAKAQMNEPRLFDFKNKEALDYLGLDLYSTIELKELEKGIDFAKLAKEIKAQKIWRKDFGDNDKLMRMYAHALFNQGILTGEDIANGGTLEYVE